MSDFGFDPEEIAKLIESGDVNDVLASFGDAVHNTVDKAFEEAKETKEEPLPEYPDIFAIQLPTIVEIQPAAFNRYPTIRFYLKAVKELILHPNNLKKKKPTLMFLGTMDTPPTRLSTSACVAYRAYIQAVKNSQTISDNWHFTVWATLGWWVRLCTNNESVNVKVRVWNTLHPFYGGFKWYPYVPSRMCWASRCVPEHWSLFPYRMV